MNTYTCGYDYGNALTKFIVYQGDRAKPPIQLPSAVLKGNPDKLLRAYQGMQHATRVKDILGEEDHILSMNGGEYYVGHLALNQANKIDPMTVGVASRYWEHSALYVLLTASGTAIHDADYELIVVTGLPVISYHPENVVRVKALYNGTHHFTLDTRERTAHIKVGKVLAEAAGAIIVGGLEDEARTYGVLDIGSYTMDLYTLDGLFPVADKCASYEVGISTIIKWVNEQFEGKYQFPLSPAQQAAILPCYEQHSYDALGLQSREQSSDIMNWTTTALKELASQIENKVAEYWRTGSKGLIAANFARVEVVGGGAYYLTEFIQRFIPHARMLKNPEFANVRGYAWFAYQGAKGKYHEARA